MATWRTTADGKGRSTLRAPLRRLRDEILDLYLNWREQAAAVEDVYETWAGAPAGEGGRWFAVYVAALDREEAAARSYADALASGERLSPRWGSARRGARNSSAGATTGPAAGHERREAA